MDFDDAQSSVPSESLHTIPIYNLDASSASSDSDDQEGPQQQRLPAVPPPQAARPPSGVSMMSQRQHIQPPMRTFTMPVPRGRQTSEVSMAEESVQTRPSVDEEYLFEEEDSEEDAYPTNIQLPARPADVQVMTTISAPPNTASPSIQYDASNIVDVPDLASRKMDTAGLRPLSLLGSTDPTGRPREVSISNMEKGHTVHPVKDVPSHPPKDHGVTVPIKQEVSETYYPERGADGNRRTKEEGYRDSHYRDNYRDSSDLLPLTLVGGGTAGGLSFSTNYAYLGPPFGRTLSRTQVLARVAWFSQLFIFNIVYACFKLIQHSPVEDGKNAVLNLVGLVVIPLVFLVVYIVFVTIWTYLDLRNKGFKSAFTVLYYSPFMLFSIFFGEKKRVDVSEFHEVNYGAKWWRLGTSRVREGIVMSIYCLFIMSFVLSDLIGRAVNSPDSQVSAVFSDFVPVAFMFVAYFLGFVASIWAVVEAMVGPGVHGSGEGRKRLVGVLPNAFKSKAT